MFPVFPCSFLNILHVGSCLLIPLERANMKVPSELHAAASSSQAAGCTLLASSSASDRLTPSSHRAASWLSSHLADHLFGNASPLTSTHWVPWVQSRAPGTLPIYFYNHSLRDFIQSWLEIPSIADAPPTPTCILDSFLSSPLCTCSAFSFVCLAGISTKYVQNRAFSILLFC